MSTFYFIPTFAFQHRKVSRFTRQATWERATKTTSTHRIIPSGFRCLNLMFILCFPFFRSVFNGNTTRSNENIPLAGLQFKCFNECISNKFFIWVQNGALKSLMFAYCAATKGLISINCWNYSL